MIEFEFKFFINVRLKLWSEKIKSLSLSFSPVLISLCPYNCTHKLRWDNSRLPIFRPEKRRKGHQPGIFSIVCQSISSFTVGIEFIYCSVLRDADDDWNRRNGSKASISNLRASGHDKKYFNKIEKMLLRTSIDYYSICWSCWWKIGGKTFSPDCGKCVWVWSEKSFVHPPSRAIYVGLNPKVWRRTPTRAAKCRNQHRCGLSSDVNPFVDNGHA